MAAISGVIELSVTEGMLHVLRAVQLGRSDNVPSEHLMVAGPEILNSSEQLTVYSVPDSILSVSGVTFPFSILGLLQGLGGFSVQVGGDDSCPLVQVIVEDPDKVNPSLQVTS